MREVCTMYAYAYDSPFTPLDFRLSLYPLDPPGGDVAAAAAVGGGRSRGAVEEGGRGGGGGGRGRRGEG